MIGFFDSGLGGLSILKEAVKLMPEYDYVYFGDNARIPYGMRSDEIIYEFTREGVEFLFKQGAQIVILACNTASGVALRRLQQEFLPENHPDKKILGIIIPTAEEADSFSEKGVIGIMGTEATIRSKTYEKEINKLYPGLKIIGQACPLLSLIIEAGEAEWEGMNLAIKKYLKELLGKEKKIDSIILGCTHYGLISEKIKKHLPDGIRLIPQGEIVAEKLKEYLRRHADISDKINKSGSLKAFTSEKSERIKLLSEMFYGDKINIQSVNIGDD